MVHHRSSAPIKPTPLVGPWKCNVCNAKFTDIKAHVQHMGKTHIHDYPSSCQLCLARFKETAQLGNHVCVANNKSRACSTSNNVNINNNNNSVISEKTHKPKDKSDDKSAEVEVIAQANNHLHSIIAGSSSELSPSISIYDEGPDEEDIFEAAQNPIKRHRSCSTDTSKGLANSDFLVVDPWQACSAIIYSDGNTMVVGGEKMVSTDKIPGRDQGAGSSSSNFDSFIEELIQPIVPPPPPLTERPSGRGGVAPKLRQNAVKFVSQIRRQSNSSNASIDSGSFHLPSASTKTTMPQTIETAASTPATSRQMSVIPAVTQGIPDIIAGNEEELGIATASHHGIASQPGDGVRDDFAYGFSLNSSYSKLICTKCKLKFPEYRSWVEHLVSKHINSEPVPVVMINKVGIIDVDEELGSKYRVHSDESGHLSISLRSAGSSETECSEDVGKSSSPTVNAGEQKKEGLKLTLCRSAGTYILKRKSTESPEAPTTMTVEQNAESCPSGGGEITGHALPGTNTGKGSQSEGLMLPSPSNVNKAVGDNRSDSETVNRSSSPKTFRFLRLAENVIRSIKGHTKKQSERRLGLSKQIENAPKDDNAEVPSKSSMTSPSTSESSLPRPNSNEKEKERQQGGSNMGPETETDVGDGEVAIAITVDLLQAQTKKVTICESESQESQAEGSAPDSQIADLTNSSTSSITRDPERTMTVEKESGMEREGISPQNISGGSEKAILPENVEKDQSVEENNDEDDALVIDTGIEEAGDTARNDEQNRGDMEHGQNSPDGQGSPTDGDLQDPLSTTPPHTGENNNQEEVNEDFRCQVCHKMFASDDEVNTHFSTEHFRTVGASILEPESPFPGGSAEGFIEDEMEMPEHLPVETQLIEYPDTTLNALLRRDSNEGGEYMEQSRPLNYPQGIGGLTHSSVPMRQPIHPGRSGYPPPRMSPPFSITSETRPMGPPAFQQRMLRPSNYPSALHRALVDHNQGHFQGPPPPRPQLRPMPSSTQVRGGMPTQHNIPNRPPLTRVPPAVQMNQMGPRNPNSILRPIGPSPQRSSVDEQLQNLRNRIKAIDDDLKKIYILSSHEANPVLRQNLLLKKNELMRYYQVLTSQLMGLQTNQQQQQEILQRQQMLQQDAQNLQQQQLRQHQLQQARNRTPPDNHTIHHQNMEQINANGKRPGESSIFIVNDPKQPRFDNSNIYSNERNMSHYENSPRLPNGTTIRSMPPQGPSVITSQQTVRPGMHSGSSTGSRHSSGSTSPAIPSPVAQRLAHSGITLTPTSPSPLTPLSPPANPNLSPISDTSPSPRGSPRIQVGQLVQNVMNACAPNASSVSPGGSMTQQSNHFILPPKPPVISVRANNDGRNPVLNLPHTDRPERPPTVDLTDDDVQAHNAQMRATGGGAVSQNQIQFHEAAVQRLQQRRPQQIPGTSQFSIRPVHSPQGPVPQQVPQRPMSQPPSNTTFNRHEPMNQAGLVVNRQTVQSPPFRQPPPQQQQQQQQQSGLIVRRASPGNLPHIRPNTITHGVPPQRPGMQRPPNPTNPGTRQHNQPQSQLSSDDCKNLVIPLIHIDRLDSGKIRALNDIGVTSFIPLESVRTLGIPVLRLRPDVALGHFPHDTAVEIGSAVQLTNSEPARPQPAQLQIRRTPPVNNIPVPSHAAAQPSHHPQPPSVISPPMGTVCSDRSCPEMMQRPSPTSVIHHSMNHAANHSQITVRPVIHLPMNNNSQYQQRNSPHDSFLGGSNGNSQFGGNRN